MALLWWFLVLTVTSGVARGQVVDTTEFPEDGTCPEEFIVELTDGKLQPDDSLMVHDRIYPPGTFWIQNGTYLECNPCGEKPCINKCFIGEFYIFPWMYLQTK